MKFLFSLIAIIVIVLLARRKLIVYQRGDIINKPNIGGSITQQQVGGFVHNFLNNPTHWSKIFETVQEPYIVETRTQVDIGKGANFDWQWVPYTYVAYNNKTNYYWKNSETLAKILTTQESTTPPVFP